MEKRKIIKISLSTFFLIIAIIALLIMGFFVYKLNNEKTVALKQINTLESKSADVENSRNAIDDKTDDNTSESKSANVESSRNTIDDKTDKKLDTQNSLTSDTTNNAETYTYENMSGYFTFDEKIPVDYGTYTSDSEACKFLYLYKNGVYFYEGGLGNTNYWECGNYIIKDDNIILHSWFGESTYGDGKGLYLNEYISLLNGYKFNINSLDSISPELGFTNYPKVVMKRETNAELVKAAASKYEEKLKHDSLYNYSNTDMYKQQGQ